MAECNVSIDQKKLPGVKEVCRDFAVLEDHCLAYNLQEQEIESHLASNVHKSRLVQQDLQVAKKLQEEEDERAKIQSQKKHGDIEQQDNEIAQEIQEELVRQAEQQRQQQELQDAAIARKLQEKEKREERRRQKQLEGNNKEDYYEDHGAAQPLDLDKHTRHKSLSPGRYDSYSPVRSHQNRSPDYYSAEPKRSRYPKQDSAAPRGHSKYPEHYLVEGGRGRHADPYPDHLLPSRGKHEDRYPQFEPAHTERARDEGGRDADRVMKRKERPARPPPPKSHVERDEAWNGEKHRNDRGTDYNLDKCAEKEYRPGREWEKSRDQGPSGDRYGERERQTHKDRRQARNSEEEEVDVEGRARSRQRVHSNPFDVFDEHANDEGRGDIREVWDPHQGEAPGREHGHNHANRETGRILHKGSGEALVETEMGLSEATKGLTKLDLREQEFKDMEVARKLQEEELKASSMHSRAQLAKDEELARRLMEQEKKEYKRNREREKEKERERAALDRMAMDKRRQEGNYRLNSEEVVRPRTRDEYDYQRQRNVNKPARPPQPRTHDYENVNPGYGYPDHLAASRPPARPEAAYKGAYNKR